jgi:hypothetical protein
MKFDSPGTMLVKEASGTTYMVTGGITLPVGIAGVRAHTTVIESSESSDNDDDAVYLDGAIRHGLINCTVVGDDNTLSGTKLTVVGDRNTVNGTNADVYGGHCVVTGTNVCVYGHHNRVSGTNADARGDYCTVTGTNSECTGRHGSATGTNAEYHDRDAKLHKHPPPVCRGTKRKLESTEPDEGAPPATVARHAGGCVTVIDRADVPIFTGNMSGCTIRYTNPTPPAAAPDTSDIVQLTPTGEDVPATDAETPCLVCLENKRQLVIVECGHLLCFKCARAEMDRKDVPVLRCPLCRGAVRRKMIRVFA